MDWSGADDITMYHDGMRELQDRYGGRKVADALEKHRKHVKFSDKDREFIQSVPFFFLATSWQDSADCSIKSGYPGFIRVLGPNQLDWPDYDGNRMYRSLGNIARNPFVGMLFVKFEAGSERIRLSGKAEIIDDPAEFSDIPGAKCIVRVTADYIFYNCPRSIPSMKLVEQSPYLPREGYTPPRPQWKDRDYIRDIIDD